ncbi:MAG: type IX secretion system plug protein domain-containing protein [Bacteroidota bacterium]|nr:type IX secretion system plug protein domain-containing protein [Bacteroidota bacterium]
MIYGQEKNIKSIELFDLKSAKKKLIFDITDDIVLSFDHLTSTAHNFYVKIEHNDYNWNKSTIRKNEYLNGYDDVRIKNYQNSYNTIQDYINYQFNLSNNEFKIKKSGNYNIVVNDNYGNTVFNKKIIITRKSSTGIIEVTRTDNLNYTNSSHQLKVTIPCINCQINSNQYDYVMVIYKNNDLTNPLVLYKPDYALSENFIYDNLIFDAGSEYLNFDNSKVLNSSSEIMEVRISESYETILYPDVLDNKYSKEDDLNGIFKTYSNTNNPRNESEYSLVHFKLSSKNLNINPLKNDVFIVGDFNRYQISDRFKLNFNEKYFEKKILLKQGFYNYKYVINDSKNDIRNFWQTENSYTAILYEKDRLDGYFKIISVATKNSSKIVN